MSNIPPPPLDADSQKESATSRLRFDLAKYDQVVGITEAAVNSVLASVWEPSKVKLQLKGVDDDDKTITYVAAEVEGTILAPYVEFSGGAFEGTFYMNFSDDCKFRLLVLSGMKPKLKEYSVGEWSLAWKVNFSSEKIDKLPDPQKRIVQNLDDYTPNHVFIDFTNSNLLVPDEDKSNTPPPPGLDPAVEADRTRIGEIRSKLSELTQGWLKDQIKAGKNVFGYTIQATNLDSSIQSSLRASALSMQIYPYSSKGNLQTQGTTPYHPWSCFLFANMFGKHKLPQNDGGAITAIPYSGNLVTPFGKASNGADNSQMAGTLVIRNDSFMSYLTEVFKDIADDMFLSAMSVDFKSESVIRDCRQDFKVEKGTRRHRSDFQKSSSRKDNGPTTVVWSLPKYAEKAEGYDEKGLDGCLGANEGNLVTTGNQTISVTGGENVIRVKGSSDYKFTWHTRIAATWWNQGGWPYVSCGWDWDYAIKLVVTQNGTLQLHVDEADFKVTTRELKKEGTIGYYMDDINAIKGLDSPVTATHAIDAIKPINEALKTAGIFVLPAAGQYIFYNPVFDSNADLMVSLKLDITQSRINGVNGANGQ